MGCGGLSAASRDAHENIVQVFDGGVTEEGDCYVGMERLGGQSLAQLLRRGRLNVGRTAKRREERPQSMGAVASELQR